MGRGGGLKGAMYPARRPRLLLLLKRPEPGGGEKRKAQQGLATRSPWDERADSALTPEAGGAGGDTPLQMVSAPRRGRAGKGS